MPNYPPEMADLSAPRLVHWMPPRRVTEVGPTWSRHRITLTHQPLVWYPAYTWGSNTFQSTRDRLPDVAAATTPGYTAYAPVILTVGGAVATDRTNYQSAEAPALSDYTVTNRIDYYLDGRTLVTNVAFETLTLSSTAVVVTYTSLSTCVQLVVRLRTNTTKRATTTPTVDAYTIALRPGIHPHQTE